MSKDPCLEGAENKSDQDPHDWKRMKLGHLADFKNGLTYKSGEQKFTYPILSVASFKDYSVINNMDILPKVSLDFSLEAGWQLLDGDLVFVRSNGNPDLVGRCVMVFPGNTLTTFSGFTIRARIKNLQIIIPDWVHLCIKAGFLKRSLLRESAGTNITNLNQQILSSVEIPLPSLKEQKSITKIFSTWDEAIEKTKRLIQLKEKLFVYLINKLVRRKNTDYEEFKLGYLAKIQSGGTPSTSNLNYYNGHIPWVSISDMTSGGKYVFDTKNKITQMGLKNSSAKLFPSETVLYAMYASIGKCSIAKTSLCTSQAILGIQPSPMLYHEYLYYFLVAFKNRIRRQGQQGAQKNLNTKMVKDLKISIPPLDKQRKIAGTLDMVQTEINLLIEKMKLLYKQKHGLMQKLLSGKWRVNF